MVVSVTNLGLAVQGEGEGSSKSHLLLWPMRNASRKPWASCTQNIHNEVLFARANTLLKLWL